MTELINDLDTPSDAELISRVRGGDLAAYGELFERHVDAARRLSRQLLRGPDADDLVSDAFTKVMTVLQKGGGPDVAFRAYLLTAVRRLHVDKIRSQSRLTSSDDMTEFDPGVPFHDTAVAGFESGAAAKAFSSLPERWQLVLWHLEVEGQKPADIAPLLGMSANSVSALAYRAREGLRQAFLTAHLADTSDSECRWVNEHLGAYVRQGLSKRDAAKVKAHLDECRKCTAMYLELSEVNSNLSAIIAPLLLGGAAAGYLATTGGAAAAGGILLFLDRAKDAVMGNIATVAAGTAAAAVAAVAVVAIAMNGNSTPVAHPPPPGATQPAPPAGSSTPPAPKPSKKPHKHNPPPAVVPPVVVPVVNQPSPTPTQQGTPTANISLASASISDGAVVLDIGGLPANRVVVGVDLRSKSGTTTFKAGKGACTVLAGNKHHAACVSGSGSGGDAIMLLAPSRFQAVIPLDYPASLQSDELTVTISIAGYDDPSAANNTAHLTFTPNHPTPTPSPTPSPSPTPTPTPPPPASADLHLALAKADDTHVTATVTGLPADPATLRFDVSGNPGVTLAAAPAGCASVDADTVDCAGATGEVVKTFAFAYDPQIAPVAVTLTVSAVGVTETQASDNTASISIGTKPVPTADLSLDINGNSLPGGIGLFRVNVHGIPTGKDAPPVTLDFASSRPDVGLEGIPDNCTYANPEQTRVDCVVNGSSFTGVFDANLRSLGEGDTVDITVTVSVAGYLDPDLTNNAKTVRLSLQGILGISLAKVLGEDTPLEPVGSLVDSIIDRL
jgi:RNA polymerase sigma factor (sigma-70 family)